MSADRYLEPAFIRELRKKAVGYYIGADQYKSSAGKRFPKHVTQDRLFRAIASIRSRGWAEQNLLDDFAAAEDQKFERFSTCDSLVSNKLTPKGLIDILDEQLGPPDPEPAKTLSDACIVAVRRADIGRLKDIVKFCELFEREKQNDLPWEYYAAMVTPSFLARRIIPTKKQVREAALKERAIAELPVMYKVGTQEMLPKMREAGEPKEMRIDLEPAPDQDADNYYGADQDELEYDPASKPPAEEQKPTLAQQRAKQIADRVEELLRRYTPSTWRHVWKRVFKNLELDDLPR